MEANPPPLSQTVILQILVIWVEINFPFKVMLLFLLKHICNDMYSIFAMIPDTVIALKHSHYSNVDLKWRSQSFINVMSIYHAQHELA